MRVSLDIRFKLAGLAFGLVSVVVIALTIYFSAAQRAASEKALEAKALTYAQLFARQLEEAVAFDDVATTREVFEAASLDPDISAVTLYKANGSVLDAVGESQVAREAVDAPVVHRTSSSIVSMAPVASREGPQGVLVVELSQARIRRNATHAQRGAAVAGLVAMTLGLLASWLIGGSFARRVRRIQKATQAVADGDLAVSAIEDDSNDEIGRLGGAFNRMSSHIRELVERIETSGREEAKRLDRIVVARTMELQCKNEDLALILDNAGQGFLTVYRNGCLASERSAILIQWFGDAPEGVRLWDYVTKENPEVAQWLIVGWEALFDGFLPPELALDQLPKEVRRGRSIYGLRYQPVVHEDRIEAVVVVVSDITEETALRHAEATHRELAGIFARLVSDPTSVEQFIAEGHVLVRAVESAASQGASRAEMQRCLHTLKGNAAFLGLESIAKTCHGMESEMTETGEAPSSKLVRRLADLWAEFVRAIEPLVFGQRDRAVVRIPILQQHIAAIRSGAPRRQLAAEVETWLLEPTSVRLERAASQAAAVARRLEKPEPSVTIEDHGVRLDAHVWGRFWSVFVHVVRNAVDHGLESEPERLAAGKPAAGAIVLRTFHGANETVVEIEDDGVGIDWAALRKRGGLPETAPESEVTELLFRDGVSTKSEASETSGRGVGLAAAREACEAMGGHVNVRSRRGVGTVFSFHVPSAVALSTAA